VSHIATCYICWERTVEEHGEFRVGQHLPPTELVHFVGESHGRQLPVVEMLGGVGQDGWVRTVVLDQLQKAVVGLVDRQVAREWASSAEGVCVCVWRWRTRDQRLRVRKAESLLIELRGAHDTQHTRVAILSWWIGGTIGASSEY